MPPMFRSFEENISAGARLALLREVRRDAFTVNWIQAVTLLLLGTLLGVAVGLLSSLSNPAAESFNWANTALSLVATIIAAYAVAAIQGKPAWGLSVITTVMATSILPLIALVLLALLQVAISDWAVPATEEVSAESFAGTMLFLGLGLLWVGFGFGWILFAASRALSCVFETSSGRTVLLLVVYIAIAIAPKLLVKMAV